MQHASSPIHSKSAIPEERGLLTMTQVSGQYKDCIRILHDPLCLNSAYHWSIATVWRKSNQKHNSLQLKKSLALLICTDFYLMSIG